MFPHGGFVPATPVPWHVPHWLRCDIAAAIPSTINRTAYPSGGGGHLAAAANGGDASHRHPPRPTGYAAQALHLSRVRIWAGLRRLMWRKTAGVYLGLAGGCSFGLDAVACQRGHHQRLLWRGLCALLPTRTTFASGCRIRRRTSRQPGIGCVCSEHGWRHLGRLVDDMRAGSASVGSTTAGTGGWFNRQAADIFDDKSKTGVSWALCTL